MTNLGCVEDVSLALPWGRLQAMVTFCKGGGRMSVMQIVQSRPSPNMDEKQAQLTERNLGRSCDRQRIAQPKTTGSDLHGSCHFGLCCCRFRGRGLTLLWRWSSILYADDGDRRFEKAWPDSCTHIAAFIMSLDALSTSNSQPQRSNVRTSKTKVI